MLNKQHTKYLGIDYGKKRIGVSISDNNKVIAFPLETIETNKIISFLEDLVKKEKIEKIIIGKPLNLYNQLHELEIDIIEFSKLIKCN